MNRAIYLRNGQTPDEAIERTLLDGGVFVEYTHTIAETLQAIYDYGRDVDTISHVSASLLVVAEVQCGGIPLLTVIREEMRDAPQVMLLDRSSENVRAAVQALQLGASEYLLSSDSARLRSDRTRTLIDRIRSASVEPSPVAGNSKTGGYDEMLDVDWDPIGNCIHIDRTEIRLTPIQARIFGRLWQHRNSTVSTEDLVRIVMLREDIDVHEGSRLLRPHLVRLRDALDNHPKLAHRIVNIRGSGYMMI